MSILLQNLRRLSMTAHEWKRKWTNLEAFLHTVEEVIFPLDDYLLQLVLPCTLGIQPVEEGLNLSRAINKQSSYP